MMKGIFVNEDGGVYYANAIVRGIKPVETRSRNMLKNLVGERVAVVRTHRKTGPMVVGYVTISLAVFHKAEWLDENRDLTLIPKGSKYDTQQGRWCYWLRLPQRCKPYPLPKDAVRHGRSWCEWKE